MVEGQMKDVETLTGTIANMTKDLSSKESQVGSLSQMVGDLRDSVEVETH